MGTRNLTCVFAGGEYRIAQYGQYDGYPEGQGVTALEFLRGADLEAFRRKVVQCVPATDEEIEHLVEEIYSDEAVSRNAFTKSDLLQQRHPQFHRNTAADILDVVMRSPDGLKVCLNLSFAADSLFCEWCYVIDLDAGRFEVFRGFNMEPLDPGERFAFLGNKARAPYPDGDRYYPVRLLRWWPLDALPSKEEFLRVLDAAENEITTGA